MPLLFLLLFLACAQTLSAQHQVLRGQVVYLNSGKQPAVGVQITGHSDSAGQATPVYSSADGSFQLEFPRSQAGDLVRLRVGSELQNGEPIEVVNHEALQYCRIPHLDEPTAQVHIVVCPKGTRDQAALGYYRILKHSATLAYEAKQAQFSQLLRAEHRSYDTIAQLSKAIDQLAERMDSLTWYKEALYLASINRDNASARTLDYLCRIEAGEAVQEARQVLDIAAATGQLAEGLSQSESAIEELELRARASYAVFDYNDAVVCYERIIGCLEAAGDAVHPLLLGEYYRKVADVLQRNGNYSAALIYGLKDVGIQTQCGPDTTIAISQNNIASIYQDMAQFNKALTFQLKAICIEEQVLPLLHPNLATSYNNIASIYLDMAQFNKALVLITKAIYIQQKILPPLHPNLASSYNNIAAIYRCKAQFNKALTFQLKAIQIEEQILDSQHPDLARSYNNIALIYQDLKQFGKALTFQLKATYIREQNLDSLHPDLAQSYNNIALIYQDLQQFDEALTFQLKAIYIYQQVLPFLHPSLATANNNLASIYQDLQQFDEALTFQLKATYIREQTLDSLHPDLATSYGNLALIYYNIFQFNQALAFQLKAINIQKQVLDTLHADLVISYGNLALFYTKNHQFSKAKIAFAKHLQSNHDLGLVHGNWTLYYALLNHPNKALTHMEKAIQAGLHNLEWFQTEEGLDSIRDHPKFKRLLKQLKAKLAEEQE